MCCHEVPAPVIPRVGPSSLPLAVPLVLPELPVWPSIDWLGHHRSVCAVAGVLGLRGFAIESAIARICREGGARVSTNVFVRDLDLAGFNHLGLSLFGGALLATDTTLVSALPLRQDRRKERTHLGTVPKKKLECQRNVEMVDQHFCDGRRVALFHHPDTISPNGPVSHELGTVHTGERHCMHWDVLDCAPSLLRHRWWSHLRNVSVGLNWG